MMPTAERASMHVPVACRSSCTPRACVFYHYSFTRNNTCCKSTAGAVTRGCDPPV